MSYQEDIVIGKLSALNETQEGIVGVAQWILFHRRHAERTANIWLQRLKESPPNKRLNLLYLANEVVQQSKARKKLEFAAAFSPIIAEATQVAYKGATNDIQQKIRRTVEVWRQRSIFDGPIQDDIEQRLDEADKSRSGGPVKKSLGGSLFSGSSVPKELAPLVSLQQSLAKAETTAKPQSKTATDEYQAIVSPSFTAPTPPVYAHRLSGVLRNLANAEIAVSETLKARRALISGLEKLLEENREALATEEKEHTELATQKSNIEAKKREVEDHIMRGLDFAAPNGEEDDADRPEIEQLTPPPIESLTPTEEPPAFPPSLNGNDGTVDEAPTSGDTFSINLPPGLEEILASATTPQLPQSDANSDPRKRARVSEDGTNGSQPFKRRSLGSKGNDEMAAFANDGDAYDGLDDDVKGMLDGV